MLYIIGTVASFLLQLSLKRTAGANLWGHQTKKKKECSTLLLFCIPGGGNMSNISHHTPVKHK